MKKKSFLIVLSLSLILALTGCSPADTATYNIKEEAETFSLYRKLTAVNLRTDQVLFTIEGFFNYENEVDGDLSIVSQIGPNRYKRDVVHVTEGVTFVVEQLDASQFSPYSYTVRIYAAFPDIEIGAQ